MKREMDSLERKEGGRKEGSIKKKREVRSRGDDM
jgi:hypothetical protein